MPKTQEMLRTTVQEVADNLGHFLLHPFHDDYREPLDIFWEYGISPAGPYLNKITLAATVADPKIDVLVWHNGRGYVLGTWFRMEPVQIPVPSDVVIPLFQHFQLLGPLEKKP